jgi:hypothetical protein
MLATGVPLAATSEGKIGPAAVTAQQTTRPATRAPYVPERLRDLRLDDGIEPALRFRPRV